MEVVEEGAANGDDSEKEYLKGDIRGKRQERKRRMIIWEKDFGGS